MITEFTPKNFNDMNKKSHTYNRKVQTKFSKNLIIFEIRIYYQLKTQIQVELLHETLSDHPMSHPIR